MRSEINKKGTKTELTFGILQIASPLPAEVDTRCLQSSLMQYHLAHGCAISDVCLQSLLLLISFPKKFPSVVSEQFISGVCLSPVTIVVDPLSCAAFSGDTKRVTS